MVQNRLLWPNASVEPTQPTRNSILNQVRAKHVVQTPGQTSLTKRNMKIYFFFNDFFLAADFC